MKIKRKNDYNNNYFIKDKYVVNYDLKMLPFPIDIEIN